MYFKDKFYMRTLLGNASYSLIKQFENWWDKYAIPLSQINSDLKTCEAAIHKHLKDYGYE